MAVANNFPHDLVVITMDDYGLGMADNTRRTPFEDGSVSQKRISSRQYDIRNINIAVKQSNREAFRAWLRETDGADFNFFDLQDADPAVSRVVHIQGGAGSVQMVWAGSGVNLDGERYWTATLVLEGYW